MKIKLGFICLMVFVVFLAGLPDLSYAADKQRVRVVEGLVDRIVGESLVVRKKLYPITGVPLEDPSGQKLARTELQKGRKVAIFLRGGSVTSILIYDKNMVE